MLSRGPRVRKEEFWNRLVRVKNEGRAVPKGEEGVDE
jgi:hypothetical protein